jgi:galactose mutarotase-like enzyme
MAKKTWTLTDVDSDQYLESLSATPSLVGGAASGYAVTKRTLRGGRRDGVDVIEVDNGTFRFVLVPTRGMGLWKASLGQIQLGWKSPVKGPVHPSLVHLDEASGLGWLEGFDELMVRCGLESNGAPEFNDKGAVRYPLHGKIANIPAHKVELAIDGDAGQISVTGEVDEARLFGNKLRLTSTVTTRVGQPGLTIIDTVTNLSGETSELELLYHTNFGLPLVGSGAKIVLPVVKMAPRDAVAVGNLGEWDVYGPETPGLGEAVFFFDLASTEEGFTQALLRNAAGDQGVSLKFNKNQLPCFTLWKNRQAAADGYVTGLEPAINFPNNKSFEKKQGRVALLAPGESRSFELTIEVHPNAASVANAEQKIAALQKGITANILPQPDPQWSPA